VIVQSLKLLRLIFLNGGKGRMYMHRHKLRHISVLAHGEHEHIARVWGRALVRGEAKPPEAEIIFFLAAQICQVLFSCKYLNMLAAL